MHAKNLSLSLYSPRPHSEPRTLQSKANAWIATVVPLPQGIPVYYEERYYPISIARKHRFSQYKNQVHTLLFCVRRVVSAKRTILSPFTKEYCAQAILTGISPIFWTAHNRAPYHQYQNVLAKV